MGLTGSPPVCKCTLKAVGIHCSNSVIACLRSRHAFITCLNDKSAFIVICLDWCLKLWVTFKDVSFQADLCKASLLKSNYHAIRFSMASDIL